MKLFKFSIFALFPSLCLAGGFSGTTGGTPASPLNAVQFNSTGTFNGSANFTTDGSSVTVSTATIGVLMASSGTIQTQLTIASIPAASFPKLASLTITPANNTFSNSAINLSTSVWEIKGADGAVMLAFNPTGSGVNSTNGINSPALQIETGATSFGLGRAGLYFQEQSGIPGTLYVSLKASNTVTTTNWILPNKDTQGFWQSDGLANLFLSPTISFPLTATSSVTITDANGLNTTSVIASTGSISSMTVTGLSVNGAGAGQITMTGVAFSSLSGAATNGSLQYCSDCTVTTPGTCTTNVLASCICAGSGSGAFAKRLNGSWYCN